jgi:hypothetical protein
MVNVLEKSELPSSNPTITYNTYVHGYIYTDEYMCTLLRY